MKSGALALPKAMKRKRAIRLTLYGLAFGASLCAGLALTAVWRAGMSVYEVWLAMRAERAAWVGVVDRLEEGKAVVVPFAPGRVGERDEEAYAATEAVLPLELLPGGLREGEVVTFTAMRRLDKTRDRHNRIKILISRLCSRQE